MPRRGVRRAAPEPNSDERAERCVERVSGRLNWLMCCARADAELAACVRGCAMAGARGAGDAAAAAAVETRE